MLSKWSWIVFNLIIYASTAPWNEVQHNTAAYLELIELEYEDACYNITDAQWSFIVSPSNETLSSWEVQLLEYAKFQKLQKSEIVNEIRGNSKEQMGPSLQYKYNVIEKPGDALMKDEDWKKLIHFAGVVELQQSIINLANKSQNYSREDAEYLLSHNGKPEAKYVAWSTWYRQLTPLVKNYSNNLLFVPEVAKENGAENVEKYWEMLSGHPDGYDKINSEWSRVNNLHKKLVKFISANLAQKYELPINDTFAHLLGSLQGYDWTDISSDVLPYPELMYDIKKNLWKKKSVGKSLYKTASNLGSILLKQVPQAEFWDKSEFNRQCPSRLLNFCRDGTMRVSTCSKASVNNFLTAHEDVGRILFNQITEENTPILNIVNRYSGLEESISTLFGIISASPAWLNHTHLINDTIKQDDRMIVSLMLTALNVLPRLAYYYSADLWRINAINKNITDPADLVSSWWKYRQEYEGISSNTNSPTFLDDSYIIRNKPYLPKILGIIVAFQLYEFTLETTEVRYDDSDINGKLINGKIIKMIQHGGADDWQNVLDKYVDIDDISVDSLISYFTPLEEFIEEYEEEFEYKSGATADKELEELEKHMLQEINAPSTTPPTTTTNRITTKAVSSSYKTTSNAKNMPKVEKSLESKSSVNMQEDQPNKPESNSPTERSADKSLLAPDTVDENSEPKINTRKAVWAISAVLVAIVVICIIAIFGRRRCRKTPKNRRYV